MIELLTGAVTNDPLLVAVVVGAPTAAIGFLTLRQSAKKDRMAQTAAITSSQTESSRVVIEGLDSIIANLQADNRILREGIDEVKAQNRELIRRVAHLELKLKPG